MRTYVQFLSTPSGGQVEASVFQKVARAVMLAVSVVVGAFVLFLTASAALVVVLSLIFIGLIAFAVLWTRAKLFGKSIGGKAFDDMRAAAKAQQESMGLRTSAADYDDGDVINAHKTPDGWTVD